MTIKTVLFFVSLVLTGAIIINYFVFRQKLYISVGIFSNFLAAFFILLLFLSRYLDALSYKVGVFNPPSLYFFVAFLIVAYLLIYLFTLLSNLKKEVVRLYQELSILKSQVDRSD